MSKSSFFLQGGELGELTRRFDWSKTSLGKMETWPITLRGYVNMVLSSRFPMLIFWGPELLCFYNDAFRPSLGDNGKHPDILGMKGKQAWAEVWDFTGPLIERILNGGEAAWYEDQSVPIYRNGGIEDVYWTFSYSPLADDNGTIAGVLVTCTETTKTVKTVWQLQESEKRFRNLADRVPQFIWMTGPTGIEITYVNKPYLDFLGLKDLNDFLGGVWQSLIHPDDLQMVHKMYSEAVAEKKPSSLEARYKNAETGLFHWFLIQGQPRYEPDGAYAGFVGTLTDITTPKEANDKLHDSEARLELLSNAVPAMIFLLDAEQCYQSYNQTFMEWFGVDEKEAVGKTVREFIGEAAYQIVEPHLANAYAGNIERYELMSPLRMRGPQWLSIVYTPHKADNETVLGVIAHVTDITQAKLSEIALRESEGRFRSLIEEAPVATCLFVGRELRIQVANDIMLGYWGKDASVVGIPLAEAVPELLGQPFLDILDKVFNTGKTFTDRGALAELKVDGKIGTFYFDYTYKPLFDASGKVYAIMDMAVDVTTQVLARQKIEELVALRTIELAEANLLLKQNNRELEQFAYIASHDLQEPLRKVSTFAQMLESHLGEIDERSKNYFNKIASATLRMMQLVRDVLDFSQLSNQQRSFEPVDLGKLMDGITTDFELLIEQKKAVVSYKNLPIITANALQMRQLFGNLLSNSLKFTKDSPVPAISINAQPLPANQKLTHKDLLSDMDYWLITIEDNGIGFSEEHSEKIFSIFQRLHAKSEYAGTGIGLALCKKIAQNHHGEIWATSEKNNGANFYVILPRSQSKRGIKIKNDYV